MPLYLETRGNSVVSIAVCDRCKMKRAKTDMRSDPNFPGLQVCGQGCQDEMDPYRLAARKTEKISIRFARPDVSIAVETFNLITSQYGGEIISTQQNQATPEENGNIDQLRTTQR
jgi:hypothetical protein